MKLPEIVMDGSQVIHTDEDGNILLEDDGDQRLHKKKEQELRDAEIFEELFRIGKRGPRERVEALARELFDGEEILLERFRNTMPRVNK